MQLVKNISGKTILKKIKSPVKTAWQYIAGLWKFRKDPPCIIFLMDGGIASQMYQYICGQILIDRGYKVKYDCLFYKDNGMDLLEKDLREFSLDKLCNLPRLELASREQINFYKQFYMNKANQPPNPVSMSLDEKWQVPVYLGNYYLCDLSKYPSYFQKYISFKPPMQILDKQNLQWYEEITQSDSVGVHIRRGDMMLSVMKWAFPEKEYFVKAMHSPEVKGKKFFLFSDDMEWVKTELLPELGDVDYRMMDFNNSARAYMDFYLLSHCKSQIVSQGSFGVVAFVVNPNPEKLLMIPDCVGRNTRDKLKSQNVIYWTTQGERLN